MTQCVGRSINSALLTLAVVQAAALAVAVGRCQRHVGQQQLVLLDGALDLEGVVAGAGLRDAHAHQTCEQPACSASAGCIDVPSGHPTTAVTKPYTTCHGLCFAAEASLQQEASLQNAVCTTAHTRLQNQQNCRHGSPLYAFSEVIPTAWS